MGLMEKALQYKNKISGSGKKTIMDRIAGPADGTPQELDGDAPLAQAASDQDIIYLKRDDLVMVDDEGAEIISPADGAVRDENDGTPSKSPDAAWEDSGVLLDNLALYELSKDILKARTTKELFDVILFSVMGQVGVSSSSIMMPSREIPDEWEIDESRGVTINRDEVNFRSNAGILKQLITRKEIIDMDEFKDDPEYSDDYLNYISIDAKLLVPIIHDEDVLGAIVLGNKLNAMDYTGEEKGFFTVIAEYSAFSYRAIRFKEINDSGSGPGSHISSVDAIRGKMVSEGNRGKLRNIIQDEMQSLGVTGFAVFVRDEGSSDYILFTADREDQLKLENSDFRIPSYTSLIQDISHAESPIMFNEPSRSKSLIEVFTDKQVRSMPILDLFTFTLEGELLGFIMMYDMAQSTQVDFIHARLMKLVAFIFPYILITSDIEYHRGGYIDTIERVYDRVNVEIKNARDLNIPLTLVLLSIKNYKRFHSLFGHDKAKAMFSRFEKFVRTRLSERDFSVRYDRNKILIVLPGKDKKYAVPLANTVANEMIQSFSTRDVQLLVTFLTAEYPIDGKDAYGLVDAVN